MLGAPYKSKKALRENIGKPMRVIETSMFGNEYVRTGVLTVVGPDPYTNRKWFARVQVHDGLIVKVS